MMRRLLPLLLAGCRCEEEAVVSLAVSNSPSLPNAVSAVGTAKTVETVETENPISPPKELWSNVPIAELSGAWTPDVRIRKNSRHSWEIDSQSGYVIWCELNPRPQLDGEGLTWFLGWCKEAGQRDLPTMTRIEFYRRGEVLRISFGGHDVTVTR
jgi:hypothetical protein